MSIKVAFSWIFFFQILIEDIEEVRECKNDDENHQIEWEAFGQCCLNQAYIVCKSWEESHPVEDLDPH